MLLQLLRWRVKAGSVSALGASVGAWGAALELTVSVGGPEAPWQV